MLVGQLVKKFSATCIKQRYIDFCLLVQFNDALNIVISFVDSLAYSTWFDTDLSFWWKYTSADVAEFTAPQYIIGIRWMDFHSYSECWKVVF